MDPITLHSTEEKLEKAARATDRWANATVFSPLCGASSTFLGTALLSYGHAKNDPNLVFFGTVLRDLGVAGIASIPPLYLLFKNARRRENSAFKEEALAHPIRGTPSPNTNDGDRHMRKRHF